MREPTYRTIGIAVAYREGTSSGWYWVSTYGPDPNRSRESIEGEQAADDGDGLTSVTVRVPLLPHVVVTSCSTEELGTHERCVHVTADTSRAPTELQIQRRGAGPWARSTFAAGDSKIIRIKRGIARVRVLAYDADNRWPTRGPWRVIRP